MVERIAMRSLDDDFGFHPGEIGQLLDELFVVAGENARQSRLHRRRGAGRDQRGVAVRKLQHVGNALSGGNFQLGNTAKMQAPERHDGFHFGAHQRPAKHGHGALAIDDRSHAQLLVDVSGFTEAGNFSLGRTSRRRAREKLSGVQHRSAQNAEAAHEIATRPFQIQGHGSLRFAYLRVTAAVQLISTSELPGRLATATVVRAGPPCGK